MKKSTKTPQEAEQRQLVWHKLNSSSAGGEFFKLGDVYRAKVPGGWLVLVTNRLRGLFSVEGLRYAALIVFTVVVGGGSLFVAVEPAQQLSVWDGLWWSTETVTTVAYGDIYPETSLGRVVATGVMATGIAFVALLTGSLAQHFLHSTGDESPEPTPKEAEMMKQLREMSDRISRLQAALERRDGSPPQ